jgi:hypothetical protein
MIHVQWLYVTGVTRSFIKLGVSPGTRQNRLRQHGTLFSFSHKNPQREFLCEKDREFSALPEAEIPFRSGNDASVPDQADAWSTSPIRLRQRGT